MSIIFDLGQKRIGSSKKKEKTFKNKSEVISEIKRLYTLGWIADSKVEIEYHTGRVLNPQQMSASTRNIRKANTLAKSNGVSDEEIVAIANSTYKEIRNKLK